MRRNRHWQQPKTPFEFFLLMPRTHPSCYVIEEKRLCWPGCDPAGYLGFCRARSVIDRAADVVSAARAKIHGPSGRGWIASISPASAASRSVLGAIWRSFAALLRLSHGSIPSSGLNTGMRLFDRIDVTRSRVHRLPLPVFRPLGDQAVIGDEYELAHGGDHIGGRAVPLTRGGAWAGAVHAADPVNDENDLGGCVDRTYRLA